MPSKLSKNRVLVPDRKSYGTERVTSDPILDDTQEAPMKAPEKTLSRFERGFEVVKMPAEKGVVEHSSSSTGKERTGPAWVHPARR